MPKMKLSCHVQLDQVRFVMKTKQDNDMSNHISPVYSETETKLLGPI